MTAEERLLELTTDIDLRLANLWAMIGAEADTFGPALEDDTARQAFASALRMAYAAGYQDALEEARQGDTGKLLADHGYALP